MIILNKVDYIKVVFHKNQTLMSKKIPTLLILFLSVSISAQKISPGYAIADWKDFCSTAISYLEAEHSSSVSNPVYLLFDQYHFNLTTLLTRSRQEITATGTLQKNEKSPEQGAYCAIHRSPAVLGLQDNSNQKNKAPVNPENPVLTQGAEYGIHPADKTLLPPQYIAVECKRTTICSCPDPLQDYGKTNMSACYFMDFEKKSLGLDNSSMAKKNSGEEHTAPWITLLLNGADSTGHFTAVQTAALKKQLAFLYSNQNTFWVSSYGTVLKYLREKNQAEITETCNSKTRISFRLSHPLNPEIYNEALSIQRKLPAGWESPVILQNGDSLSFNIVTIGGEKHIRFNAFPNKGIIHLFNSSSERVNPHENQSSYIKFTQSGDAPKISFNLLTSVNEGKIEMLDDGGKTVYYEHLKNSPVGLHKEIQKKFSSGFYVIRFKKESKMYTSRIFIY